MMVRLMWGLAAFVVFLSPFAVVGHMIGHPELVLVALGAMAGLCALAAWVFATAYLTIRATDKDAEK